MGYEPEELTKKTTIWDIIERRGDNDNFRWSNFQREGYVSGKVDLKKRNGDIMYCHFNAWTHILSGKHLTILTDISESKKLERTLSTKERQVQMEQQRFYDMFREAPVSMCILKGQNHVYEKTNALHDRLIGYRKVIGKTVEECFPERSTPVLVFSMHREELVALRALKAGASGYLSKDAADVELPRAVRQLLAGRKYITHSVAELMASKLQYPDNYDPHEILSDREYQTMLMLAGGKSVSQIAEELSLGISTISTYRVRILDKMGLKNNAELTQYAVEHKLISTRR